LRAPSDLPSYDLDWIHGADDARLSAFPTARRRYAAKGFARGDCVLVALKEGELVGYVWLAFKSHRDPTTGMHAWLAPYECWAYDIWVAPEHRKTGLARVIAQRGLVEGKRQGAAIMYAAAHSENRASIAVQRLAGMRQVQTFRSIQVLERVGLQIGATPRRRPCCWSRQPRRLIVESGTRSAQGPASGRDGEAVGGSTAS
jgi:GNAT superfamily N-acetyltransferase